MKKLILFTAVVAAVSFASCKKDRTCTCTNSNTDVQTVVVDWQTSPTTTTTTTTPGSDVTTTTFLAAKKGDAKKAITLYQKFVFNLSWDPEKFSENQPTVDDFLASGELEFF